MALTQSFFQFSSELQLRTILLNSLRSFKKHRSPVCSFDFHVFSDNDDGDDDDDDDDDDEDDDDDDDDDDE